MKKLFAMMSALAALTVLPLVSVAAEVKITGYVFEDVAIRDEDGNFLKDAKASDLPAPTTAQKKGGLYGVAVGGETYWIAEGELILAAGPEVPLRIVCKEVGTSRGPGAVPPGTMAAGGCE